jgi:polygalacturonase
MAEGLTRLRVDNANGRLDLRYVQEKEGITMHHRLPARLFAVALLLGFLSSAAVAQTASVRDVITDYGAIGDGKTMNTRAIQAVIDHIAANGGGTLVVPKGVFMSGALFFKQGVNLDIEADGVLKGTIDKSEYPQINTRWEGEERLWTSAFLNFDHMSQVSVSGDGTIDGSGDLWMQREPRIRGRGGRGGNVSGFGPATNPSGNPAFVAATTNPTARLGRPRLVCFSNCQDVHIANLHLIKQAIWCLHILYSQNVTVDGLTIDAMGLIPSSDGIDVDSSRDVQISHCNISCNDDDISIKSGKNDDGRRVNRPSENITISDCTIGAGGGIAMGSEVTGSVRHVLVQRCVFNGTDAGARFKSAAGRGGVLEDIVFRDITINNTRWAFDFNLAWGGGGFGRGGGGASNIVQTVTRGVQMINYHGTSRTGGTIRGLPNGPFQDVKFVNCNITAQTGIWLDNAKDLDTAGLNLTLQSGPMFIRSATRPN